MKALKWGIWSVAFSFMSLVFADTNVHIGIVDLQKIMQTSAQMKAIQQKLEKDFRPRRDKLMAMEGEIKKEMERFKRESAVMSQEQKRDLERKIMLGQQTFEREGQQYQQELNTAHNDAMEELYNKIRKAISNVAAKEKYDIILQKEAAPYSAPNLEITDKVVKELA